MSRPVLDNPYDLDSFTAVGIAEGFEPNDDVDRGVAAWQYLVDSGLAWTLQGWFGRTATELIERGVVQSYPRPKDIN